MKQPVEIEVIIDQMYRYGGIINTCTLIIGLVGNITGIVVISTSRSFYTLTGFYLLSLTTADLIILIMSHLYYIKLIYLYRFFKSEPSTSLTSYFIGEWIGQTALNVSVFTVTAFTVDRYLAICHPFFAQTMPKKSRAKKIITGIWSISASLALLPVALMLFHDTAADETSMRTVENAELYAADVLATLYFFAPMSAITVMYMLIWLKLKKNSDGKQTANRQTNRADTRTLMMFVLIVAVFCLSWGPYYAYKMWVTYLLAVKVQTKPLPLFDQLILLYQITIADEIRRAVYPLSSAVNPIIYSVLSKQFREAFKDLLLSANRKLINWSSRLVGSSRNETSAR